MLIAVYDKILNASLLGSFNRGIELDDLRTCPEDKTDFHIFLFLDIDTKKVFQDFSDDEIAPFYSPPDFLKAFIDNLSEFSFSFIARFTRFYFLQMCTPVAFIFFFTWNLCDQFKTLIFFKRKMIPSEIISFFGSDSIQDISENPREIAVISIHVLIDELYLSIIEVRSYMTIIVEIFVIRDDR